ncbi:hypothetical protein ACJX0J_014866 [Zea mays]
MTRLTAVVFLRSWLCLFWVVNTNENPILGGRVFSPTRHQAAVAFQNQSETVCISSVNFIIIIYLEAHFLVTQFSSFAQRRYYMKKENVIITIFFSEFIQNKKNYVNFTFWVSLLFQYDTMAHNLNIVV